MNLEINYYGQQSYVAVKDLSVPAYYAKKQIEGHASDLLKKVIDEEGIKSPIVINTHVGREGVIVKGVQRYLIAQKLGIYDLPFYAIEVDESQERHYHYFLSIQSHEYSIEQIIEHLKSKRFESYFEFDTSNNQALHKTIFNKAGNKLLGVVPNQERRHTFPLRLNEAYKDYPKKLQELLKTKSMNEAIIKMMVEVVEGRIVL
jgi:hypothetical protein